MIHRLGCLIGILIFFNLTACCKTVQQDNDKRSFWMGFTAFPYDNTLQALNETFDNVLQDGDIILVHLDNGVPWQEALDDLPFPNAVQFDIDKVVNTVPSHHKIFLTATPNDVDRESLAHYWNNNGTHQDLPAPWNSYTFSTPQVISAYIKYCKRLIDAIHPDYFAYGIEVNGGLKENTANYNDFLILADTVYNRLKHDYPDLPILMTFQDQSYNKNKTELLNITQHLVSYSDMMAVSTYPFWLYDQNNTDANPDNIPSNWLSEMKDLAPGKPFAVSETGYIAEDLNLSMLNIHIAGNENWQKQYVEKLLNKSNDLNAEFVCWFVYRDYDLLYQHTPNPPEYFLIWKDTGLRDGVGNRRPGLQIWKEWLNKNID